MTTEMLEEKYGSEESTTTTEESEEEEEETTRPRNLRQLQKQRWRNDGPEESTTTIEALSEEDRPKGIIDNNGVVGGRKGRYVESGGGGVEGLYFLSDS